MQIDIGTLIMEAHLRGCEPFLTAFKQIYERIENEKNSEIMDLFLVNCLKVTDQFTPDAVLWGIVDKWQTKCGPSSFNNALSPARKQGAYDFAATLRSKLSLRLESGFAVDVTGNREFARLIIVCWREIFLASYSVLYQHTYGGTVGTEALAAASQRLDEGSPRYYNWLLQMSMFYPFDADRFTVNVEQLITAAIPAYCKVILVMWLVAIPRYNGTQYHRQKLLEYFEHIQRVSHQHMSWMDPHFHLLAEWLMVTFFRAAYLHENNAHATFLFGDFVTDQMSRNFPQFTEKPKLLRQPKVARKIRIGYVSSRFVSNAVTFYMANRIIHHDRNTFEVYVFAIGAGHDGVTDRLAGNCDHFIRLGNSLDYQGNAQQIVDSELDILLFADIGMDIITYLLGGLRLAPIQCALLGHASTTGLPNIDYYFTSEIESEKAHEQYREKVVMMPNVGSAQLIPPGLQQQPTKGINRQQLGIPEDAFVFVSCANGMKHIPERDYIYTEILRRVPNAWILIKPFSVGDYDQKMVDRFSKMDGLAGGKGRIVYLPGCDSQADVFAYLGLANAQLDSFPFNGWTTSIEAFCLGLPTITQEGNAYRSRIGAGFLRAMGISEGIAGNEKEYIAWAVRFAQDANLRQWVRNRIKATRKNLLFKNVALQAEYEKALIEIFDGRR